MSVTVTMSLSHDENVENVENVKNVKITQMKSMCFMSKLVKQRVMSQIRHTAKMLKSVI